MRRRFIRLTGSLLGLLAILLMALVPAFSHALSATHDEHGNGGMPCSMPSMQQHHETYEKHNTHGTQLHLDACGYCSLLAHLPAITPFAPPSAVLKRTIVHRVKTRFERVRANAPLPFWHARAPPSLFS